MEQIYYEDDPKLAQSKCAACLKAGGTAIIPAGTVYGVVAHSESADGYRQIFQIKHRTPDKPIALLVTDDHPMFHSLIQGMVSHDSMRDEFLAGRLTVVVEADYLSGVPPMVQQIQPGTVGVRYPANSPASAILQATGGLIWATSANFSGQPTCSTVEELTRWLHEASPAPDLVVLSRRPQQGQPSRVINLPT